MYDRASRSDVDECADVESVVVTVVECVIGPVWVLVHCTVCSIYHPGVPSCYGEVHFDVAACSPDWWCVCRVGCEAYEYADADGCTVDSGGYSEYHSHCSYSEESVKSECHVECRVMSAVVEGWCGLLAVTAANLVRCPPCGHASKIGPSDGRCGPAHVVMCVVHAC